MKLSITTISAAVLIAIPISAKSEILNFSGPSRNLFSSPGDSPKPVPPAKGSQPVPVGVFNFAKGKAIWDRSQIPTEEQIISTWKTIGYADLSWDFGNMRDVYNSSGVKNADGTAMTITFSEKIDSISNQKILSAEFLTWGGKSSNQGPYESSIDPDTRSAVASVFANRGDSTSYFRLDCRISIVSSDQLICAITLKLDANESQKPEQLKFDNVMGGIIVFKRAN